MSNNGGQIYHDHNTTSAIDYTVYVEHKHALTVYINRGGSGESTIDGVSSITLMEIAG
jgi:metal-responsive CopG/Arc/MetJ family transcriptional regulator